jgi:hypothetical protein
LKVWTSKITPQKLNERKPPPIAGAVQFARQMSA